MIHLKKYEEYKSTYISYPWKSIYQKDDDKLIIKVFELAEEMESELKKEIGDLSKENTKFKIIKGEEKYYAIVKDLLIGKVITFYSEDQDEHITDKCYDVSFSASDYYDPEQFLFAFEYIFIHTKDDKYSIQDYDDLITIHLNIDPNEFENMREYNL